MQLASSAPNARERKLESDEGGGLSTGLVMQVNREVAKEGVREIDCSEVTVG